MVFLASVKQGTYMYCCIDVESLSVRASCGSLLQGKHLSRTGAGSQTRLLLYLSKL